MHKNIARLGAVVAVAAGLGLGLAGTASAQMALNDPDFQAPYSAVDPDSVRLYGQTHGSQSDSQIYGEFLGLRAR